MKSTLAKLSLLTLVGAASVGLTAATYAADAPHCPKSVEYPFTGVRPLDPNQGGGWTTQTLFDDPSWEFMQVNMYDSDVNSVETAIQRGEEIQKSVFSVGAERKIYFNENRTGDYFYSCVYPIEHKYVGIGDSLIFFSHTFSDSASGAAAIKAVKQRTMAEKVNRVLK